MRGKLRFSAPKAYRADEDNDSSDELLLEVVGSQIFFYSDIEAMQVMHLNKALLETSADCLYDATMTGQPVSPIKLRINSNGGDVHAGLAAMDTVRTCKVPVHTIVEGCAASAASLISIVGHRRFITKHSCILIHQIRSDFWGKYNEIEDEKLNLDMLMSLLKSVYSERTKIPKATLNELLNRDLLLDAKTALKYGLVDEIL